MGEKIPFFRPFRWDSYEIGRKLEEINGKIISNGENVRLLENRIKEFLDVDYVIATNNCTMALILALKVMKKEFGFNKVQLPSFTWHSTFFAVECNCMNSVDWVDIDDKTFHIKRPAEDVEFAMPIDVFGNVLNFKDIDIPLLYDSAHCMGLKSVREKLTDDRKVFCMSLSPSKLVTACEGGLVCTNNKEIADKVKLYRDRYSKMSEPNAIVGNYMLDHMSDFLIKKYEIAEYYKTKLKKHFKFQKILSETNYYVIAALCESKKQRDMIIEKLKDKVEFKVYFDPIVKDRKRFTKTYDVYDRILCLPSYHSVDYKRVTNHIINAIENMFIKGF